MGDAAEAAAAMETAVARFQRALIGIGARPLEAPGDRENELEQVATAIAPLALPAEVQQFWRLVHGYSAAATTHPFPCFEDPGSALTAWQEQRSQPGFVPPLLFPVCYESWAFLLVELDAPGRRGGACFTWAFGRDPFELVAADLTTYVETAAATLEAGHFGRFERDGSVWHTFDDEAFHVALEERLREDPHPEYGAAVTIDCSPEHWPGPWLTSVGPIAENRHAFGATTSIAALRASASPTGAAARVHAVVVDLLGLSDGVRARIDDGTGHLTVWCPSVVTLFGPVCPGRFEFEVVTTGDAPYEAEAEAIAVRPLGGRPR